MNNVLINTRTLNTYQPNEDVTKLGSNLNYLFDLDYLGILGAQGEKSKQFLQGQLTCDLTMVSSTSIAQGAQCNLKGRILGLMDIIEFRGIKLVVPKDLIEATQQSLTKTAALSRVSMATEGNYCVLGFFLQNRQDYIPLDLRLPEAKNALTEGDNFCCYHLGEGFYIFIVQQTQKNEVCRPFQNKSQFLGSLSWHTLRLSRGHFDIYPETRALFLPHRLGLHQTHYLDFNKGCYKGQEIIARMHYKSTIKHGVKIASINSDQQIFSGQKIFSADNKLEIGELIDYSMLGSNQYLILISVLKDSGSTVVLENASEPVTLNYGSQ